MYLTVENTLNSKKKSEELYIHSQLVNMNLKNKHFEILKEIKTQWLFGVINWIWDPWGDFRVIISMIELKSYMSPHIGYMWSN